jgi:membrane-associated phospholipid phosphatase
VNRAPVLLATGVASAAAFALVARAVARRRTAELDHKLHAQLAVDPEHPARQMAEEASPIGKWWTYLPAAVLAATYVVARGENTSRMGGAATIVITACAAAIINKRLDALPQPPAPPGRPSITHPVFPSGHAFGTCAAALTAAYVLSREEVASAALAFPLALILPIASSAARLIEEKHWMSDVAGGGLAAMALASLTLAVYEAAAS